MFGNGRVKSGIIVLFCGVGKMLVGIMVVCIIRKGVIVFCMSFMLVVQWCQEFFKWFNINLEDIVVFIVDSKNKFLGSIGIIVIIYFMVINFREWFYDSKKMMDFFRG